MPGSLSNSPSRAEFNSTRGCSSRFQPSRTPSAVASAPCASTLAASPSFLPAFCKVGFEVIENQIPMRPQHSGDLLHWLDPGSQGLTAPFIQELTGPGRRVVFPELLEVFFEKVGANGFKVVTEQIP